MTMFKKFQFLALAIIVIHAHEAKAQNLDSKRVSGSQTVQVGGRADAGSGLVTDDNEEGESHPTFQSASASAVASGGAGTAQVHCLNQAACLIENGIAVAVPQCTAALSTLYNCVSSAGVPSAGTHYGNTAWSQNAFEVQGDPLNPSIDTGVLHGTISILADWGKAGEGGASADETGFGARVGGFSVSGHFSNEDGWEVGVYFQGVPVVQPMMFGNSVNLVISVSQPVAVGSTQSLGLSFSHFGSVGGTIQANMTMSGGVSFEVEAVDPMGPPPASPSIKMDSGEGPVLLWPLE